ncbi:MAG: SDR family oxidoreductase [bacterium]|nr:SDR family oxidoreductase [bacterium]
MAKIYLITGGAGFIGSNIVHTLVKAKAGAEVRVMDNFATGKRENLAGLEDRFELFEADIRDMAAVRQAVDGADYVLHQAALPSVPRSIEDPISANEVNITGTLNVLVAARDAGVKRVVYAGSSSAYGDSEALPKQEDMVPNPLSPYAVNKLTGEWYCRIFYKLYGLETVCLRYFNIFGPRQDPASQYSAVIPKFIDALAKRTPPTIYGDGEQSRDFTYIDNTVAANLAATTAPGAAGKVFNIACGERFTLNKLLAELKDIMGVDIPANYADSRPGDVKHSLADISKAEKILGYNPEVKFREGLVKTVEWFTR